MGPVLRLDLGVRKLLPSWRAMFRREGLRDDAIAGLTVACVALPLSLAIALAAEVDPAAGLLTAIIAGVVCALFGGTPLSVSGPGNAMAVLVAAVVEEHGLGGLVLVGIGCGLFQLAVGVFGLGRIARFVPASVVHGFTAGIGVIILVGQLPRALGLPAPDQAHVLRVVTHLVDYVHHTNAAALGLALAGLALTLLLPRLHARIPAALVAVVLPTIAAALLGLDVAYLGALPSSIAVPTVTIPQLDKVGPIVWDAFILFAIVSLETLLSASAVDKLVRSERHDPDQEMIGQGLANVVSASLGGIPITGVIARSALNVHAGARTRRASIFHSLILIALVVLAAPLMSRIPIPALAGVLLAVALRMLNPREFLAIWKVSRREGAVFLVTFLAIVFVDMLIGVQSGILVAVLVAAVRLGRSDTKVHELGADGAIRVALQGPVTFLSSVQFDSLGTDLERREASRGVVLDASAVTAVDPTGVELMLDLVSRSVRRGTRIALLGANKELLERLRAADRDDLLGERVAVTLGDVDTILGRKDAAGGHGRLLSGVKIFHSQLEQKYEPLFARFGEEGQKPHTLFITCADSRVVPALITGAGPGELFILRTMGNLVPTYDTSPLMIGEAAAVEYAVLVLGVRDVVVCGHSRCGAVEAVLKGSAPAEAVQVQKWLQAVLPSFSDMPVDDETPDAVGRANVKRQIQNLLTYPAVQRGVRDGALRLHGWYFDVDTGRVRVFDEHGNARSTESFPPRAR